MGTFPPPFPTPFLAPRHFSLIGDSRVAQINVQQGQLPSLAGYHFFNVANLLLGHNMHLVAQYGVSGYRTDQFLQAGMASLLTDTSDTVIFPFQAVNDISQAAGGFTNTYVASPYFGQSVNAANVAQVAAANVMTAINVVLSAGKRVIVISEPGAQSFSTSATVGAVLEFNERMRNFCEAKRGVLYWDCTPILWSPAASSSAITFVSGYSGDGTHINLTKGGYFLGKAFAGWLTSLLPAYEVRPSSILDCNANSPMQLVTNALFNATTGGSTSGSGTVTGSVPSGFAVTATSAGTSVTLTTPANSAGFGNDLRLVISTTGADSVLVDYSPSTSLWASGDILQFACDVAVAAASSNFYVWANNIMSVDGSAPNVFDGYAADANGAGPTEAYTYHFQTMAAAVPSGAVKNWSIARLQLRFAGAGSATVNISRFSYRKRFTL